MSRTSQECRFRLIVWSFQPGLFSFFFTVSGLILRGWDIDRDSLADEKAVPVFNVCISGLIFSLLVSVSSNRFWLIFVVPFLIHWTLHLGYTDRAIAFAQALLDDVEITSAFLNRRLRMLITFGKRFERPVGST
jgi:hypothetical protein